MVQLACYGSIGGSCQRQELEARRVLDRSVLASCRGDVNLHPATWGKSAECGGGRLWGTEADYLW